MSSLPLRALCSVFALLLLSGVVRADTLRIGSWDRKTDPMVVVSEAVLTRAYAELNQPVEFVELPLRRALQMMLSRELDGNVFRVAELAATEPTLYRVATPIAVTEVRAYVLDPKVKPASWAQLVGLRVAYIRGTLLIEKNLPAGSLAIAASSQIELFRMLKMGLCDVLLMPELEHSELSALATAPGARRLDGALERLPLHHYLTARHQELGKRLDAVLKRMEASGEAQAIKIKKLSVPAN